MRHPWTPGLFASESLYNASHFHLSNSSSFLFLFSTLFICPSSFIFFFYLSCLLQHSRMYTELDGVLVHVGKSFFLFLIPPFGANTTPLIHCSARIPFVPFRPQPGEDDSTSFLHLAGYEMKKNSATTDVEMIEVRIIQAKRKNRSWPKSVNPEARLWNLRRGIVVESRYESEMLERWIGSRDSDSLGDMDILFVESLVFNGQLC